MIGEALKNTLHHIAAFYDQRKVGDMGALGFRRSSDLKRLLPCIDWMINQGLLFPGKSRFLDLGAADGRVNVLLSYLVESSVGIELDEWTLDEYGPLKSKLESELKSAGLSLPPDNLFIIHGDSTDQTVYDHIREKTGVGFEQFDLFYTYLTMHEEFAELIARKGKTGATFMVYGLEKILPRLQGFRLLTPQDPLEGILALYQKK